VARKVLVELADDLDGSPATQTIRFGFQGVEYELDLNDENAAEMTHWLENYVSHARRVGGQKRPAQKATLGVDASAVRAWAHENGIDVSERGRIAADITARFLAAH
jgi:hypothetical protein